MESGRLIEVRLYIFLTKTCAFSFYSSDAISFLRFLLQMVNFSNQQNGTQNETSFQWLSSSECIAWLTVFMTESVAIATFNILTIIVFAKNRGLRKRSMYLVINLAVADMFVGGYVGAFNFFHTGVSCNFWQYNWSYFRLWDSVTFALYGTFMLSSITNLAAISLERLHATFRPFKHRLIKKWVFGGAVALIWVTAGLYSIASEVIWKLGDLNQFLYLLVSYSSFLSICLFFIFVSYVSIAVKINCVARLQHHGAASREKKLTKTLFIVTVVSLMLFLPFVFWFYLSWPHHSLSASLSLSTYLHLYYAFSFLCFANSVVNPILYVFRIPEFKRALVSLLRCRSQPTAVQEFPLGVM